MGWSASKDQDEKDRQDINLIRWIVDARNARLRGEELDPRMVEILQVLGILDHIVDRDYLSFDPDHWFWDLSGKTLYATILLLCKQVSPGTHWICSPLRNPRGHHDAEFDVAGHRYTVEIKCSETDEFKHLYLNNGDRGAWNPCRFVGLALARNCLVDRVTARQLLLDYIGGRSLPALAHQYGPFLNSIIFKTTTVGDIIAAFESRAYARPDEITYWPVGWSGHASWCGTSAFTTGGAVVYPYH